MDLNYAIVGDNIYKKYKGFTHTQLDLHTFCYLS